MIENTGEESLAHSYRELYKRDKFLAEVAHQAVDGVSLFAQQADRKADGDSALAMAVKVLGNLADSLKTAGEDRAKGRDGLSGIK